MQGQVETFSTPFCAMQLHSLHCIIASSTMEEPHVQSFPDCLSYIAAIMSFAAQADPQDHMTGSTFAFRPVVYHSCHDIPRRPPPVCEDSEECRRSACNRCRQPAGYINRSTYCSCMGRTTVANPISHLACLADASLKSCRKNLGYERCLSRCMQIIGLS